MRKNCKNIIIFILIINLMTGVLAIPRTSHAVFGVGDTVVEVGPSLYQQIASAASALTTSFNTWYLQFKGSVLDTIATTLAKQLIRQITANVVNWINSGFEGSPAFVTNPGSFFLDVADQATGEFLSKYGGPLVDLCSPFSIDIRLALAFKYRPNIQKRYQCTLGTIIANTKGAAENATLNGQRISNFMDGDFSQGGWPAFISLTTEPKNNVYGAYLTADSELSVRVANAQIQDRNELTDGRGFLSWRNRDCVASVKANNKQVQVNYDASSEDAYYESLNNGTGEGYYSGKVGSLRSVRDCPIDTPGTLITDMLSNHIGGPLRELELVDSINEIVNALAAQLVVQVLQGGLKSVSGGGPSDTSSYINQIQQEAAGGGGSGFDIMRNNFIRNVESYITQTLQYKTNKDQSLNLMLDAKTSYDTAKQCYADRLIKYPGDSLAQSRISNIENRVNTDIVPVASKLLGEAKEAEEEHRTLTNLRNTASIAKTANDLITPTQIFAQMNQSQSLVTVKDITDSQQELESIKGIAGDLKQDATRRIQECQLSF